MGPPASIKRPRVITYDVRAPAPPKVEPQPPPSVIDAGEAIQRAVEGVMAAGEALFVSDALLALVEVDEGLPRSARDASRSIKGSALHAALCLVKRVYEVAPGALTSKLEGLRAKLAEATRGEGIEAQRACYAVEVVDAMTARLKV